jgi:glyoxylase-like metal-dependent hydrolase (beta-lactamase superfamily II)
MKDTRVALLDGGETYAKEYQVYWNYPSETMISMPTYGVLIDHADGLFLFDTGFDLTFVQERLSAAGVAQTEQQTIPGQLDLLGLRAEDINFVVNSHYHFDHCGGNKFCRHATTICHTCELEAANAPEPFEALIYADRSFIEPQVSIGSEIDIYTPRFETLSGDQEIARGVHLLETPGHTLGHYSLMVELAGRRPMLFTGDACYSAKGLDNMLMPASHIDPVRGYRSMERIKALADQYDAEIFFSHDADGYGNYEKAPYWYR